MRPAIALDPHHFGRRGVVAVGPGSDLRATGLADDLRLFATTFVGGFLFVAVYLA